MTSNDPSHGRRLVVPIVVAVCALVVAAFVAFGGDDDDPGQPVVSNSSADAVASVTTKAPADIVASSDPTSLGATDAPVVMVAYSEFQCPFCGKFANETLPELADRYVDTGIMRIEWRDLPYLGDESVLAARAARAAAEQDAFWEYHDQLFAEQAPKPNSGHITDEYLFGVATDLGLDIAQFEADYRSDAVDDTIRADLNSGMSAGVSGTPAFFVNGTPVFGAQPIDVFVATIEAAAASA